MATYNGNLNPAFDLGEAHRTGARPKLWHSGLDGRERTRVQNPKKAKSKKVSKSAIDGIIHHPSRNFLKLTAFPSKNEKTEISFITSAMEPPRLPNSKDPTNEKMHNHKDDPVRVTTESSVNGDSETSRKRAFRKHIIISAVLILLYGIYFTVVLVIHSRLQDEKNYWCDGDGLLIIITSLIAIMLVYFKLFKPRVGRPLYKYCIRPLSLKIGPIASKFRLQYIAFGIYFGLIVAYLVYDTRGNRVRLISFIGIAVTLLFGFAFSHARRKIVWRHVIWSVALQFALAFGILKWGTGRSIFNCLGKKTQTFLGFTDEGSGFVFGKLSTEMGIFAFKVLTVVLFFSFCIQVLYYYGAMQWIVVKIGWVLQATVGTTAGESVNAAANIFLGQTEAPLMIKLYLPKMTKSELHAVMTGGFATIAGTVMAAYISFGISPIHLISASVMNAPAALGYSKLFYPEQEVSTTSFKNIKREKGKEANVLHAAIEGVTNAIPLAVNIAANLIAIVAFIAFVDAILNWTCQLVNLENGVCSLSNIFGYALMPLAWCMGVPWKDCYIVGQLIGTKTTINEFVAYIKLAEYKKKMALTKRAETIATYALCGFSNISSIGMVLGGLGSLAPERKGDISQVVVRAMIAGNMASFLTACVAGTLISDGVSQTTDTQVSQPVNGTW